MLNKSDLNAIEQLIEQKTSPIFSSVESLKRPVGRLEKDIKIVKTEVHKIKIDVNTVIAVFDEADIRLRKRVERLEEKVGV